MDSKVWNVCPETELGTNNPAEQIARMALIGYAQLAADSILNIEFRAKFGSIVEDVIKELSDEFGRASDTARRNSVKVLLELSLNFIGMERKRAGFSGDETHAAISRISETLGAWEKIDPEAVRAVTSEILREMKMVLSGKGMVAKMAEEIEASLTDGNRGRSFVESSRRAIQENVYYQIVDRKLSKFGNDSATGLRWARHLGAVQVSSNPVIAARAYDEIPDLWTKFGAVSASHPEWSQDPERFADEIALFGTVVSLLPNILDFRPIALLSDFKDGMVSIQLNPLKAASLEESLTDALKFQSILKEILERYDGFLSPGNRSGEKTRPNIVFKVSTTGPDAIKLTETLDKLGIGTNNTVTYTVSQEIEAMLAAIRGLSKALKSGIPITTIYITNMEGRLEDHLREVEGARLLRDLLQKEQDWEKTVARIAQKIGAVNEIKVGNSLEQQARVVCSKKFLKSLVDEWFVETIGRTHLSYLKQLEEDIRVSGIYVTRKVYQIMFEPSERENLIGFSMKDNGLTRDEATHVVSAVDLLPASKRRAEDTYLVLGDRSLSNLTNTEFPDHQLKVLQRSRDKDFKLSDFENSIATKPDPNILARLLQIPDFVLAYELTPLLVRKLENIGEKISETARGIEPERWSSYGPARKTMEEFTNAYLTFRSKLAGSIARPVAAQ